MNEIPTKDELNKIFKMLQHLTNEALNNINKNDFRWENEAINWADLGCACVEYVIGVNYGHYKVTVEEASPNCKELNNHIHQYLIKHGHNVEIVTEW